MAEKAQNVQAQAAIIKRIEVIEVTGNLGDHKSLGQGLSELRFFQGPGYRVYYTMRGQKIILLLAGGDKSSQQRDIKQALEIMELLK